MAKNREPCPETLGGVDPESVLEWLYNVEKAASVSGVPYSLEDICGFVAKFYPENSSPYNKVIEIINEYYGEDDLEPEVKTKIRRKKGKQHKPKITKPRWQDEESTDSWWESEMGALDSGNSYRSSWGSWSPKIEEEEDPEHPIKQKAKGIPVLPVLPLTARPVDCGPEMIEYVVS